MTDVTVDCVFRCTCSDLAIAEDHGYRLYSAICGVLGPQMHGAKWLGVHPLSGYFLDGQLYHRDPMWIRLRLPASRIPVVLPLAGRVLRLGSSSLRVGAPMVCSLSPATALDARQVFVKVTDPPRDEGGRIHSKGFAERVRAELARQLAAMDVTGEVCLVGRRVIAVKGKRLWGYSVRVSGLSPEDSIELQSRGLGGKRAMGCGIFRPTRGVGR